MKTTLVLLMALCSLLVLSPAKGGNYYNKQVIIAVPVTPEYYYSVGETDEEKDDRKKQISEIAKEVVRLFGEKFAVNGDDNNSQAVRKVGRSSFQLVGNVVDLDSQIFAVMNTSCIKCHKPGYSKPGNIQLFTADRKLFVDPDPKKEARRRSRVYDSIDSGEMPKGGSPFRADIKSLFRQWADRKTS